MYKLFMHLDRGIVKNNELPSITSCCLISFYTIIFQSVKEQIRNAMMDLIRQDREGTSDDCEYLQECTKVSQLLSDVKRTLIKKLDFCNHGHC